METKMMLKGNQPIETESSIGRTFILATNPGGLGYYLDNCDEQIEQLGGGFVGGSICFFVYMFLFGYFGGFGDVWMFVGMFILVMMFG